MSPVKRIYILSMLGVVLVGGIVLLLNIGKISEWIISSHEHQGQLLLGVTIALPILAFLFSIPAKGIWQNTRGLLGLGMLFLGPAWILHIVRENGSALEAVVIFTAVIFVSLVIMAKDPRHMPLKAIMKGTFMMVLLSTLPLILAKMSLLNTTFFVLWVPIFLAMWIYFILRARRH